MSAREELDMGNKQLLVADLMTIDATVIRVDASVEEADLLVRSTVITGVPVVDDKGALVGVISHADLAGYRFARPSPSVKPDRVGPPPARG